MKGKHFFAGALLLGLLLALAAGIIQAQGTGPVPDAPSAPEAASAVDNKIPIQGRLTDADGHPLDGEYTITATLYDAPTSGTVLCQSADPVSVEDGLFQTTIDGCSTAVMDGRQLYLGIQVGSDAEMTPRQPIYPVPYAWSLMPGAVISENSTAPVLNVINRGDGWALSAYSNGHDAVHGRSDAPDHAGVSGTNTGNGIGVYAYTQGGTGVYAYSESDVALHAAGTGVIQSSATSCLWISGNDVRPFHESDGVIIDADTIGGAKIYRGPNAGNKNVMLPITIVGPLYGQPVTLKSLTIYFVGYSEFEGITAVLLRRQTGVCATSDCYETILYDTTDYSCDAAVNPTGCSVTYDLTQNNVLTPDSGILYLTIEMTFGGETTWFELGGVRLEMEHD